MKNLLSFLLFFSMMFINAQEKSRLPYFEIPESDKNYTAQSSVGRMIDALGFRYYWSSNNLQSKDLAYKISEESRSCQETITHIYDLTLTTLRLTKTEMKQHIEKNKMSFDEMRAQTLLNILAISNAIKKSDDLANFDTIKNGKIIVPFYNIINGSIADAIWHTGQLAVFRRASGNPINPKVNHFTGTVRK